MSGDVKIGTLMAAACAVAIAVPASAHPGNSGQGAGKSHKCTAHGTAYIEAGTVGVTSTLVSNPDGTVSGTLVVDVIRTNHRAGADRGQTVSYTFTGTSSRVRFDGGTTDFAAGERVRLIGKLAVVGKKCTPLDPAASPVFRMLVVHPAAS